MTKSDEPETVGDLVLDAALTPLEGFYRMRKYDPEIAPIKRPWQAVRIWFGPPHDPDTGEPLDRSPRWQAICNGEYVDMEVVWPWCARFPISEWEYDGMLKAREG